MTTSKLIRQKLEVNMPRRTMYDRMKAIKKKTGNSISNDVAIDVLASLENIEVYDILKKEGRADEITQFQDTMSKFDFNGKVVRKKKPKSIPERNDHRSPYDFPLIKYALDQELVKDCKIQQPYRKAVNEALLTLETRIRTKLALPDSCIGVELIKEAQNKGVFKRSVPAEEQGLNMLYRGAILWLRNPTGHRKIQYGKEDAFKIIFFADYLIKLFEELITMKDS